MISSADLEQDILKTEWIVSKCKKSKIYSQNLYAALCNNRFLKDKHEWTCSWRYAGGLLAEIRNKGEDYLEFYCSGIGSDYFGDYVPESYVTSEINNDLLNLGWLVQPFRSEKYDGKH